MQQTAAEGRALRALYCLRLQLMLNVGPLPGYCEQMRQLWSLGQTLDVVPVDSMTPHAVRTKRHPLRIPQRTIRIASDVFVVPLDNRLGEAIRVACTPPGENFASVSHRFFRYAFVRTYPNGRQRGAYEWDHGGRLGNAIRLSRLIHPTSVDYECACIVRRIDNTRQIVPARVAGSPSAAYLLDTSTDWLTARNCSQLRRLYHAWETQTPPARVRAALFFLELAYHSYWFDVRWALLTTALETLIHIRRERLRTPKGKWKRVGSTEAFVDRIYGMRAHVPALRVRRARLKDIYDTRSSMVHGVTDRRIGPRLRGKYRTLENITRVILRECIMKPDVGKIFENSKSIRSCLPLSQSP